MIFYVVYRNSEKRIGVVQRVSPGVQNAEDTIYKNDNLIDISDFSDFKTKTYDDKRELVEGVFIHGN